MTIERKIVSRVVGDLLASNAVITVQDGEEIVLRHSRDKAAILAAMFSTDEDRLFVHVPDQPASFVYFVYGNDFDVIADYGVSLEPFMAPINDWVDSLAA